MVKTNDGFKIAELDLELRGPGEFFGTRQAGLPSFRVANLIRDAQLLEAAKREAAAVIAGPERRNLRRRNQPRPGPHAGALAAHVRAGRGRVTEPFLRSFMASYHRKEMAFPIKICAVCQEEFELKPDKPGLATRCPQCSTG